MGLHTEPPPLWRQIVESGKLCSGRMVVEAGHDWLELPLRGMNTILDWCDDLFAIQMGPYTTPVTRQFCSGETISDLYHATRLQSPVQPMRACPMGQGILNDGFLMYGSCTHGGLSGVNYYSVNPQTCTVGDGWSLLKLTVSHGRRLRGGARCRQCIPGSFGQPCVYTVVDSILVMIEDVPPLVFMA